MGLFNYLFRKKRENGNGTDQFYSSLPPDERRLYDFWKGIGEKMPPVIDGSGIVVWTITHGYTKNVDEQPEKRYCQDVARVLALRLSLASGDSSKSVSNREIEIKGKRMTGFNKKYSSGAHNFFVDEFEREDVYRDIAKRLRDGGALDMMQSAYYVFGLPNPDIIDMNMMEIDF